MDNALCTPKTQCTWCLTMCRKKRKEKFTLFSDHNGSLPRRQPGTPRHCADMRGCLSGVSTGKEGFYEKHSGMAFFWYVMSENACVKQVQPCVTLLPGAVCSSSQPCMLSVITLTRRLSCLLSKQAQHSRPGVMSSSTQGNWKKCRQQWAEGSHMAKQDHQWQAIIFTSSLLLFLYMMMMIIIIIVTIIIIAVVAGTAIITVTFILVHFKTEMLGSTGSRLYIPRQGPVALQKSV